MAIASVIATINGQQVALAYNNTTGKYEGTTTAPARSSYPLEGHYYPVSITAADDAGNSRTVDANDAALGASLRLVVKERVKPTIAVLSPTASQILTNNMPALSVQLRDDDSGVDISTLDIKLDGVKITTTTTAVDGGYDLSYEPETALRDGAHTVTVSVSDFDGNAAEAAEVSFMVDTTPPELSVNSPADGLKTNTTSIHVTGVTNDATTGPVTIVITVNGTDAGGVNVAEDGSFDKAVTLAEGDNTIVVIATDRAGKTSVIARQVFVKTTAPIIHSAALTPNPTDAGKTYIITVEVTEQ